MKFSFALAALLALSACGGNPLNNGGPGSGAPVTGGGGGSTGTPSTGAITVPSAVSQDLASAVYDPVADTVTVKSAALDSPEANATYTRNPALDQPGFKAYTSQQSPLDRMFIALVGQADNGTSTGIVVGDGGQFNKFFAGSTFARNATGALPTSGEAKYAGSYAGITNMDGTGADLKPVTGSPDPSTLPAEAMRTTGDGFLIVNFADSAVNGSIYNRKLVGGDASTEPGGVPDLPSLTLTKGNVDSNGQYTGTVEFSGRPDLGTQGSYAGAIGGKDQGATAGGVALTGIYPSEDARYDSNQRETGTFVMSNCKNAGSPAICSSAAP